MGEAQNTVIIKPTMTDAIHRCSQKSLKSKTTRHARQADRPTTNVSYALSAAASISSDAVPVGNVPCGDDE